MRKIIDNLKRKTAATVMLVIMMIVLPFNILTLIMNRMAMDNVIESARNALKIASGNVMTELEGRMSASQYLIYNVYKSDAHFQALCSAKQYDDTYTKNRIQLFWKMEESAILSGNSDAYFIYNPRFDDLILMEKSRYFGSEVERQFVYKGVHGNFYTGCHLYSFHGDDLLLIMFDLNGTRMGSWIWLDNYVKELKKGMEFDTAQFYFTEAPITDRAKEMVSVHEMGKRYGVSLVGNIEKKDILGNMSILNRVMKYGVVLSFMLIPMLYLVISWLFLRPLSVLSKAHKKIQGGDLSYRIIEKAPFSEYEASFSSFNAMVAMIRELKIENYEKEINSKELELSNLQLQIRPHFLLNTFNLIYTLVQENKNDAVEDVIIYLSDYFRYLFRDNSKLQLFPKEQHLIEGYMKMAKIRYPNSIEIDYSYDPEIMMVRIPPLLIHNFVENIVKHVVHVGTVTHISIVGEYIDRMVEFMIMDDGQGMSEEAVRELTETMKNGKNTGDHVGYANSYQRIRYFYGEDGDISITSDEGIGTCVTITFPYDLEVDDDNADCQ